MKKPKQDDLFNASPRAKRITTNSTDDYYAMCRRIKEGEFACEAIEVGKTSGEWVFVVREKQCAQSAIAR